VARDFDPVWLTQQVRALAMAEPEAEESLSHGMACFGIKGGKKFAWVSDNHHGDGRVALLVKVSGPEEQAMLIERDEDRYFKPAYFGNDWIAIRLDLGGLDWEEVRQRISASWLAVAPAKLKKALSVADEF
jgi:phosphoribosylglycinamide formyltransferase-1